jgi:pimeloyl-ACP methyl ester carboxylesterase
VCLPGLARTAGDFDPLARALAGGAAGRRVLALDSRGRGRSEHDPDWRRYDVRIEAADAVAVLDAAGIERAIFVGTSRGGLLTMGLAALRPCLIAGVVLNDIGPVIEPAGLMRIRAYVGRMPRPRDWAEGADTLRRISDGQFPRLTDDDWYTLARGMWVETESGLAPDYDPRLAKTLESLDLEQPLPPIWPYFDALPAVPILVVRGGNSDILSAATVDAMAARRPGLETHVVPDQGHAPLLREPETIAVLADFIGRCGHA